VHARWCGYRRRLHLLVELAHRQTHGVTRGEDLWRVPRGGELTAQLVGMIVSLSMARVPWSSGAEGNPALCAGRRKSKAGMRCRY
jgi:hypothetical protein